MSNSTYEVHHKKDKDFKTVEMHSHDFSEIYFFLQGSASYIVEDCKYSLRPGDVLLIPPNKLHQLDIKDSAMTYERFVVWLNQRYLKRISTAKTDLNTCFLQMFGFFVCVLRAAMCRYLPPRYTLHDSAGHPPARCTPPGGRRSPHPGKHRAAPAAPAAVPA